MIFTYALTFNRISNPTETGIGIDNFENVPSIWKIKICAYFKLEANNILKVFIYSFIFQNETWVSHTINTLQDLIVLLLSFEGIFYYKNRSIAV